MSERHPDSAEEALIQSGDGAPDDAMLSAPPPESDPEWSGLLEYLLTSRGFDFHGYKAASLARRIRKRMESVGVETFAGYQEYLEVHPNEFATLFNTILINVTSFFRDPASWEVVRTVAVPEILAGKAPGESLRAWSVGCASGEEAYTIAMILAEELGLDEFRERVKIYATDVDEDALDTARRAAYSDRQVEGIPPELLTKYFEKIDGLHLFRKDARRSLPDLGFPERERRAGALMNLDSHLQMAALEASPVAQLVVDAAGQVVIANDRARDLFALRHSDVGRPLRDLPLSYRPLELRSLIERAETERRNVGIKEIEWRTPTGD